MDKILALDPATQTGWALAKGDNIRMSGVWDLSIESDESNGIRLLKLWNCIEAIDQLIGIDFVVYEDTGTSLRGHARRILPAIQGIIELWCCKRHIPHQGFSPTEVKKHATGKGKCNKDAMIAAAKKKWPDTELFDDNQVDAMWLLDLYLEREND